MALTSNPSTDTQTYATTAEVGVFVDRGYPHPDPAYEHPFPSPVCNEQSTHGSGSN